VVHLGLFLGFFWYFINIVFIFEKVICGKAKLLLAQYVDRLSLVEAEEVTTYYNEAKLITANEDSFYSSASFFDKILGKNYEESELDKRGDLILHIISQVQSFHFLFPFTHLNGFNF